MSESIVGQTFSVLDQGYITVRDFMGGDESIVNAARISYGKGTRKTSDDEKLIRYLMRHHHTSPFEMAEIVLEIGCPMDVWRQWIRHRTASVNEYSTRYSEAIDMMQRTAPGEWRAQSTANKQGSGEFLDPALGVHLSQAELDLQAHATAVYKNRLHNGVAREQARKDLPLSTYTKAIWKIDLKNLLHFLWLRMDSHAQKEIREYATIIGNEIVAKWCPMTWQAFCDYVLYAMTLSVDEIDALRTMMRIGYREYPPDIIDEFPDQREGNEFVEKLKRFLGDDFEY